MTVEQKNATIRDVARLAGVSPATVSRYMNRTISLPEGTSRRIDKAIAKLNYHPNSAARNLSLGKSHAIGLVTPDIANPFFASLASAVEEQAAKASYSVILCSSQNKLDREITYLNQLSTKQLDGLLFLTSHGRAEALADLIKTSKNIVLVDEDVVGTSVHKLLTDNEQGGYLATKYLLEAGHRRVAHVGGPDDLFSAQERYDGYKRALGEAGIREESELTLFGPYTAAFGARAAERVLRLEPLPTAIFAASDYVAIGMLNHFNTQNIKVPEDISMVGFDDVPFAHLFNPPLSTIRQPIDRLGQLGFDLLLSSIEGEPGPPTVKRLPVELIERESVRELT